MGRLLAGSDWPGFAGTAAVTNAYVVGPPTRPSLGALSPSDAVANFQVAGARSRLGQVVWSSPVDELDRVIAGSRPAAGAAVGAREQPVTYKTPPSRFYIIGHPRGRDPSSRSRTTCSSARRSPAPLPDADRGRSSGSPVFDDGWRLVGLRHAGDAYPARLDDSRALRSERRLRLQRAPGRRGRRVGIGDCTVITRLATLDDVIGALTALEAQHTARRNRRAVFVTVYTLMSQEMKRRISARAFRDNEWVRSTRSRL